MPPAMRGPGSNWREIESVSRKFFRPPRIMWSSPGAEPVGEPEEVLFIDVVQHHNASALDDFVLQGRDRQRPLPSVRLRYVRPARRLRPIRSPPDPCVQILETRLQIGLVRRRHQHDIEHECVDRFRPAPEERREGEQKTW